MSRWLAIIAPILLTGCMDRPSATDLSALMDWDATSKADVSQCVPGISICTSATTWASCNPNGTGVGANQPCGPGLICEAATDTCVPGLCPPAQTVCTDLFHVQVCGPTGQSWAGSPTTCQEDHFCMGDACVYAPCVPTVLLLVDRSGSMGDHWIAVRTSVEALLTGHPDAAIGLMSFPIFPKGEPCEPPAQPQIAIAGHQWPTYEGWFNLHPPEGGTPLYHSLLNVAQLVDTIFYGQPGAMIVLSDGEDTCAANPIPGMTAVTQSLRDDYDIQTYVIGYAFQGNDAGLTAIASQGGTGFDTYITAGNETELSAAFDAIVDDFKLCGSP